MSLSEPFIRRPVMTVVLTVSVSSVWRAGVSSSLPVNDLPAVDYPVIQVSVSYPGATPETMANNVATPLERQFMQIPGLEEVTSNSGTGHTSFVLQFALSKSLDAAATDVQAAITQAHRETAHRSAESADLHQDESERSADPVRRACSATASPRASFTITPTRRWASASAFCPASARCRCSAAQSAVRIKADPSAMAIAQLHHGRSGRAIKSGTSYTGAGQFDGTHPDVSAAAAGAVEHRRGLQQSDHRAAQRRAGLFEGCRARSRTACRTSASSMRFWVRDRDVPSATVVIAVFRQAGSNAVEVAKAVRDLLPLIQSQLPGSIAMIPIYDRSQTIVNSVNDVQETLFIAFVLVVLVIFVFLGRATDTLIPGGRACRCRCC